MTAIKTIANRAARVSKNTNDNARAAPAAADLPGNGKKTTPGNSIAAAVRNGQINFAQFLTPSEQAAVTQYIPTPPQSVEPYKIGPEVLVENRPAWVEFIFLNWTDEPLKDTYVRATIQPAHSVDSYSGLFEVDVSNFPIRTGVTSAISFILPRADLGNVLTLELYQNVWGPGEEFPTQTPLDSATIAFDVCARFFVDMSPITIRDTASIHEDTLWVSLSGTTYNTTYSDSKGLGNHNNTSGLNPGLLPVGPLDVLPNSSGGVAVTALIANNGHTSAEQTAEDVLDLISEIGSYVATIIMSIVFPIGAGLWAGLSELANELNQKIINWVLADCDTVVYHQSITLFENQMFTYTFDPNDQLSDVYPAAWVWREKKKAGVKLLAPDVDWLGGGCDDSDYTSGLWLHRQRQPEFFVSHATDGMVLAPGSVATFGPVGMNLTNIEYSLEGNGNYDEHGNYKAPAAISTRKFAVLRWTNFVASTQGIAPAWQDFAVILLD